MTDRRLLQTRAKIHKEMAGWFSEQGDDEEARRAQARGDADVKKLAERTDR